MASPPVAHAYEIGALPHYRVYDKHERLRYDLVGNDCLQAPEIARQLVAEPRIGASMRRATRGDPRRRQRHAAVAGEPARAAQAAARRSARTASSLVAAAVRRGRALAGERVVIVTADEQVAATRAVGPGDASVLAEPVGRNTAAAIGLAAATLARARSRRGRSSCCPPISTSPTRPALARVLELALAAVERDDVIGTIGITPTRAETGFGYLEVAASRRPDGVDAGRCASSRSRIARRPSATSRAGATCGTPASSVASARRLLAELDAHLPATGARGARDRRGRRRRARSTRRCPRSRSITP